MKLHDIREAIRLLRAGEFAVFRGSLLGVHFELFVRLYDPAVARKNEWTSDSWNTCSHCKQCVDADDVTDGSEVRCLGCRRWFSVIWFGGDDWGLRELDETNEQREDAQGRTS